MARSRFHALTGSPADGISLRPLTVLVGDVVSYSRLVEEDGVGAVLRIRAMTQSILTPLARRYRACPCRAFGGDGALMGFTDPSASIRCAVDLAGPSRICLSRDLVAAMQGSERIPKRFSAPPTPAVHSPALRQPQPLRLPPVEDRLDRVGGEASEGK